MKRFECGGRLHISIPHDGQHAHVHLYHELAHDAYCNIEVPDDIKQFVYENRHMMPSAIWSEVLKKHPNTELEQWQIARLWATLSQDKWRRTDDQVDSARALLEESDDAIVIPLDEEPGVTLIAFLIKECVEGLNHGVVELAMDSTWKTNALGYETYGLIAEANGQSIPLGFILTTSTTDAQSGAKDRLLQQCLRALTTWCPNARFTLSDKDTSEINACRAALPTAKHQLCYWHTIRYLEQRLGESKPPAFYDARLAHQEFDFIDPTWVPGVHNGHVNEGFTADDTERPGAFEPDLDALQVCLHFPMLND
ncbi:hypothetical protein AURDEDRAFT_76041 [Auricularia subglabra TFB-10046 SS5]|uniref:MULE transposase domain-containing protein n=1 Tax=Auricularia subglabra (strain TFB-10046 / SS5) TaxID=717982 RepID=J0WRK9_AURST|nr:hypothetical protein AURDEDRAFT_76041 [Auricularia subglabra TFB-10046 SS5]